MNKRDLVFFATILLAWVSIMAVNAINVGRLESIASGIKEECISSNIVNEEPVETDKEEEANTIIINCDKSNDITIKISDGEVTVSNTASIFAQRESFAIHTEEESSDEESDEELKESITETSYAATSVVQEDQEYIYNGEPVELRTPDKNNVRREFITIYSDLVVDTPPSIEELDAAIDYYDRARGDKGTALKGHGYAYYKAWQITGLDPVYLLSHSAWESGWLTSAIAVDKFNYYGIAAYDGSSYTSAKVMGDSIEEGIINGAIWIKEHYYDKGMTSLALMNMGGYVGAATDYYWSTTLVDNLTNPCYRIMNNI